MSTRCRIGIKNKDGTITSIYCHHDGYPDGVGEVLVNNYKTEDKIRKLLELGDISSIGTEPVSNVNAWKSLPAGWDFETWKEMNPENRCNTYRERGETNVDARTDKDIRAYQKHSRDCWGEYAYLFKDNDWFVMEYDDPELKLVKNYL